MAVTEVDPRTALIVVDLQKGILAMLAAPVAADLVQRAGALAAAFRARGLPVALVRVTGAPPGRTEQSRLRGELPAGFADFAPELSPEPGDHVVAKQTAGAFTRTDLEAFLRGRGVTQVVLAGVATSMGVEATARQAHELGFNVTVAVDAVADLDAALHDIVVAKIFPRLGETGAAREIVGLLPAASA